MAGRSSAPASTMNASDSGKGSLKTRIGEIASINPIKAGGGASPNSKIAIHLKVFPLTYLNLDFSFIGLRKFITFFNRESNIEKFINYFVILFYSLQVTLSPCCPNIYELNNNK